jgi:hypothetical protein
MKKRNVAFALVPLFMIAAALLYTAPAFSYLPEYAQKSPLVLVHWSSAPTWRINPTIGGNVLGTADPTPVIAASFSAWKTAPNVSGVVSGTTQGANSNLTVHAQDGTNLICFVCASNDFGSGGDTLAITYTAFSSSSGAIADADILFNPADDLLTNGATCPTGQTCADLQTVATHEIGHFYGLDHSAITSAVMYPFAPDLQLNLGADDVAAISNTYPGTQTISTGSLSGKITNSSSTGLCGIHVFADSNTLAAGYPSPVRRTPIGAMTLSDGTYTIAGLPPDTYTVTAEPLDGPADSTNVPDYATTICGSSTLSTNFTTRSF